MKRWSLPYGTMLAPVPNGFERRVAQGEQVVFADEANAAIAELVEALEAVWTTEPNTDEELDAMEAKVEILIAKYKEEA